MLMIEQDLIDEMQGAATALRSEPREGSDVIPIQRRWGSKCEGVAVLL